ncbi:restriction endonuclease [Mesorhizobium sp. CU2]|nr:restriction endonuclease [Mesorhizobium sp. CU3]TPO18288.1 restriction endonuclease [Mesorhizobium sp. CU2]
MARRGGFERFVMSMAREVARQQRASATAQRMQIRENERFQKQQEREAQRLQKHFLMSQREAERAAKLQYLEDREEEANYETQAINDSLDRLRNVLQDTLSVDDTISFDSLRVHEKPPTLSISKSVLNGSEAPKLENFRAQVAQPSGLAKLIPGAKSRYANALTDADSRYEVAHIEWTKTERTRIAKLEDMKASHFQALSAFKNKVEQRNAEVDDFRDSYLASDPDSIIAYNSMVLERSAYPPGFPQTFSIAYTVASKQLVIEYELPTAEIVPAKIECRYVKTRDLIEAKVRKAAEIKEIYQDVIAALALRTIHEVFEADQAACIETCCFNGYVRTVDPATGVDIQPHLISVRTTKERFTQINLARVDKTSCLRNLGAQVSRHASESQPIKPIVEFDMADARFIDQADMVSGLNSVPNLMDLTPGEFEHLVANLFGKMGLDSKLTRSSRDGGVDCVAYDSRPILGGKVVIQAKRYRHTVGVSAVRDLYGTMMNEGANKGILVTTSGYGPDAFNFSSDKPIELIDGGGLLFLLQEVGMQARILIQDDD